MKRVVAVLAILCLPRAGEAATLKELLASAEKQNFERRISLEQRRRAAAEFRAAWTGLLPSLNAIGNYTYNEFPAEFQLPGAPERITIIPEHQLDGVLRAELPLLDTTRWFRAGATSAALDAAEYRDEANWDNIVRQISTTYYTYAAAQAVRESARRSLALAQAQQQLQEVRFKAGAVTELDLARAKAEVQRNTQTVADTEAAVANTRRALRTLTGMDVGDVAKLPADNLQPEGTLEELEAKTDTLPAVQAARKDALAANRLSWAARFSLVPQLNAHFTERFTNYGGFNGQTNSYTTGLVLVWRLDGPTFFNMSAQAANASVARLASERQVLGSRDQVHNDWQRLTASIVKVTAAQAQVEAARRAAQVARDRYAAGASTQIDVIQAERDLFSAEVNQIQARTELASSHVSLRVSAGLPLEVE